MNETMLRQLIEYIQVKRVMYQMEHSGVTETQVNECSVHHVFEIMEENHELT